MSQDDIVSAVALLIILAVIIRVLADAGNDKK